MEGCKLELDVIDTVLILNKKTVSIEAAWKARLTSLSLHY